MYVKVTGNNEANARLIAAATELLEQAMLARDLIAELGEFVSEEEYASMGIESVLNTLADAIFKARGDK